MATRQFRTVPTFTEPVSLGQKNNAHFYRYLQQNELGTPPSNETQITPMGSPFIYTAPSKGFVILTGGTVSSVMFSRTMHIFYPTGQTSGMFQMAQNDQLQITFSATPSMVFVPT